MPTRTTTQEEAAKNQTPHVAFPPLLCRLSNIIAQKMSAEEEDVVTASGQQAATEDTAVTAANVEFPTKTADAVRGADPKHADAAGFHLFNVLVHAATCSSSVWVFRAVFPGEFHVDEHHTR